MNNILNLMINLTLNTYPVPNALYALTKRQVPCFPHIRDDETGPERVGNLPSITQLISDRARIRNQNSSDSL